MTLLVKYAHVRFCICGDPWLSKQVWARYGKNSFEQTINDSFIHFWTILIKQKEKKKKKKKGKRIVQGVPQTAALSRNKEEEKTNKTKQAQIEQTYEKH